MRLIAAPLLCALVSSCASSSSAPACVTEGTFSVSHTLTSPNTLGVCPTDSSPDTVTVLINGSSATLHFQGVQGDCMGKMNGCKLTAACDFTNGTAQLSWTFTSTGLTGSTALGLNAVGTKPACDLTFADRGARE